MKHLHLIDNGKGKNIAVEVEDDKSDETLEILMTDLDEDNARQFYLEHASAIAQANTKCADGAR